MMVISLVFAVVRFVPVARCSLQLTLPNEKKTEDFSRMWMECLRTNGKDESGDVLIDFFIDKYNIKYILD